MFEAEIEYTVETRGNPVRKLKKVSARTADKLPAKVESAVAKLEERGAYKIFVRYAAAGAS